jgi:ADP-ribose pyrophosphatase YjhB (NUDIX family)
MENMELRNKNGLTEKEFQESYDAGKYKRPSVTVDMLIFTVGSEGKENYRKLPEKVLKILLVKRGDHPYIGQWALPGGFVRMDESLDEAAARELKEEANVDNIYMEQLYTWGEVKRDPRARVISSSYMSLVDSSQLDVQAGDDAPKSRSPDVM